MKKQSQITEQTKANLRDAFWTLYMKKPIEKISVREITDLAGYNRGTFYLYYHDVYDLFSQIEEDLLTRIRDVLEVSMRENNTFDLSRQMEVLLELMQTHSHYASVLLSENGDPRFAGRLKKIILPVLERYFISPEGHSGYQMTLLSEFYLSGILAAVNHWLADPQMSLQEFLTFIISSVFGPASDFPQSYNSCGKSERIPADK